MAGSTVIVPRITGYVAYDPTAIAVTGGTIANTTFSGTLVGLTYPALCGGVPLVSLSSGSLAANGVISAITALPIVLPQAYCYFPANAVATVAAAGLRYCTFSTTTAGIAFLDTYTSGTATVPSSPTAVTDGKGAFVGDTGEEFLYQVNIPAGAMGANGVLRISGMDYYTNNANNKTSRIRFSGTGGTIVVATNDTTNGVSPRIVEISNTNATNQLIKVTSLSIVPTTIATSAIDTTQQTTLVLSIQKATATDNVVFYPPTIEIIRAQ